VRQAPITCPFLQKYREFLQFCNLRKIGNNAVYFNLSSSYFFIVSEQTSIGSNRRESAVKRALDGITYLG
jgi:hypothetical protein